jgi:hypothetical protein
MGIREVQNGLLQALWFVAHVVHHEQDTSSWSSQVNYFPNLSRLLPDSSRLLCGVWLVMVEIEEVPVQILYRELP